MELTLLEADATTVRAGYSCPCGCTPSIAYSRGTDLVEEDCCCGNRFGVGPRASAGLGPKDGFRAELQVFDSPWGERLEAAWLVGLSVHGPSTEHGHDDDAHRDPAETDHATVIDPVCGMTIDPDAARAKGLRSSYQGRDYFFCGKGCRLEFDDDPERRLDPNYVPST